MDHLLKAPELRAVFVEVHFRILEEHGRTDAAGAAGKAAPQQRLSAQVGRRIPSGSGQSNSQVQAA